MIKMMALVGRPNVGKSTLFNKLTRSTEKALTHDLPGVTRDVRVLPWKEDPALWIVDTGGLDFSLKPSEGLKGPSHRLTAQEDPSLIRREISLQTQRLIDAVGFCYLVVDGRAGLLGDDRDILQYLRRHQKPFKVLVNKIDHQGLVSLSYEFFQLGVAEEDLIPLSAEHNLGLDELSEQLHQLVKVHHENSNNDRHGTILSSTMLPPKEKVVATLTIMGAPNVGKSTLLNALVGAPRSLVAEHSGTTIDPVHSHFLMDFAERVTAIDRWAEKKNQIRGQDDELLSNPQDDDQDLELTSHDYDGGMEWEGIEEGEFRLAQSNLDTSFFDRDEQSAQKIQPVIELYSPEEEAHSFQSEGHGVRAIHILDTAGIRRKSFVDGFLENQGVWRAMHVAAQADLILYMVDATKGLTHQDRHLLGLMAEKGRPILVLVNKIDLLEGQLEEWKKWWPSLLSWLGPHDIFFLSAKKQKGLEGLKKALKQHFYQTANGHSTAKVNRVLKELTTTKPLNLSQGQAVNFKVKYAAVVKSKPFTILAFCNKTEDIPVHYRRYLVKGLRHQLGLRNTPVHLIFRHSSGAKK